MEDGSLQGLARWRTAVGGGSQDGGWRCGGYSTLEDGGVQGLAKLRTGERRGEKKGKRDTAGERNTTKGTSPVTDANTTDHNTE